jgi:hypothetical protein
MTDLLQPTTKRENERGAVIFIVAMTLSLLGSLGLYGIKASTEELASSGNYLRNAQTHFMTEYGVIGTANEMSGPRAQLYLSLMTNPATRDTKCLSLAGVPDTASLQSLACRRMGAAEVTQKWPIPFMDAYVNTTTPGSLGPVPRKGDFFVEVTDPVQVAPPPGFDQNLGLCFIQFTVTVTGLTQHTSPSSDAALYRGFGLEMGRGRVTGGPVRCP